MVPISREVLTSIARMGWPSSVFWFYILSEFIIGVSLTAFLGLLTLVRSLLPKPPRDLTGNVVLVTGATSTLGRCIADEFARNGCTIIRVDGETTVVKSSTDASSSSSSRSRSDDPPASSHECDLWNVKAIAELAKTIDRQIGGIDVLVTCAGHAGQDIFDTVNLTLMSHYWTTLAFLPSMLKRERAHVVGVIPTSNPDDAYAGSKAAVAGLMESLGQEFGGRSSRLNFITVPSKVDPSRGRSNGRSEKLIARDVVQAVRRDRCSLSGNLCMTLLDRLSCSIRAGITSATRWLCPRGCEYSH